ncbi:MAG: CdaR family protein [Nitrospirota bacterium]|nr:CdaR family protein [Nitrospirota bacterium]
MKWPWHTHPEWLKITWRISPLWKRLPPAWRENLPLKLFSVGVAFVLWLHVNARGQTEVTFAVPVVPADLPAGMVLSAQGEERADVRVRGLDAELQRIQARHVWVNLRLADAVPGDQWIPLTPADVAGTGRTDVVDLVPRQVRVNIEQRMSRSFRIKAEITGKPERGKRLGAVVVDPPEVTLTGGESAFQGLRSLATQAVDISGLTQSLRREVRLDLQGRDLEPVGQQPIYVTISLVDSDR